MPVQKAGLRLEQRCRRPLRNGLNSPPELETVGAQSADTWLSTPDAQQTRFKSGVRNSAKGDDAPPDIARTLGACDCYTMMNGAAVDVLAGVCRYCKAANVRAKTAGGRQDRCCLAHVAGMQQPSKQCSAHEKGSPIAAGAENRAAGIEKAVIPGRRRGGRTSNPMWVGEHTGARDDILSARTYPCSFAATSAMRRP